MDLKALLYLAALVVFALGCRTFESRWIQKAGWVALLVASYLLGWWLTGSHVAGSMSVLIWFLLPGFEIATKVRSLRFPLRQQVKGRFAPSNEVFPQLNELTDELEACGYEVIEDAGWTSQDIDHFVRLFYHAERRIQAAISLSFQGEMGVSYVSLTTRFEDGSIFSTTSFPHPPTMEFTSDHVVNRLTEVESVAALDQKHRELLKQKGLRIEKTLELDTEQMTKLMEEEMGQQVDHNLKRGLIEKASETEFRYSWRGCLFLWFQMVKEMIRI